MNAIAPRRPAASDFLLAARTRAGEQLQELLHIGPLSGHISKLIHMLQRERGASSIWLCSGGSLFAAELELSVREVDRQTALFHEAILLPGHQMSSSLYAALACALHHLERLPALREAITEQRIPPIEAIEQFNTTVRHLLSIVPETSSAVNETEVARALAALFSFMQGKELVGQERALGAIGFTEGRFSDALRQQLVDRIDSQQHCFDTFASMTEGALRERYLAHCEPCRETERLRRLACTRLPESGGEAPRTLQWFTLLTTRIDALRELEERIIGAVMDAARRALGSTRNDALPEEDEIASWVAGQEGSDAGHYPDRYLLPLVRQQARQIETMARQLASLQASLDERKVIEKAKALLIEHHGYREEQAWQTLRKMAMNQNKRMVEIATALVAVADLWQLPPKK